jgi:hypothetical protein
MSEVVFFVVLFAVLIGAYFVARATPKNIHPVPVDVTWKSVGEFYRDRPDRDTEVELGHQWTSEVDPGASFTLSWISETRELVVLRQQAHPDLAMGGGLVSAMPRGLDGRASGMKVLAVVDLPTVHATHPEQLRPLPDGLDRLTARLGRPYDAPHPSDPHWASVSRPPDGGSAG